MRTRVLAVDPLRPEEGVLRHAARVLREGKLVAFPTETVYGLGARVMDERALARIFEAKGRPTTHPLIAHVSGKEEARGLAAAWPVSAARLADALWPGPLTLVVERNASVPAAVSGGGSSIAVRCPRHAVALALIRALGEPIAAPSANRYQAISATTAAHVVASLDGLVALVLDGGPSLAGIESTVVDVRSEPPRVLRLGAVDVASLRRVEPTIVVAAREAPAGDVPRASPGQDARHYAPRARMLVAGSREEALTLARTLLARGERPGLLLAAPLTVYPEGLRVRCLGIAAEAYGHSLYATLHDLDAEGVSVIVVEPVPAAEEWGAIQDRLARGARLAKEKL